MNRASPVSAKPMTPVTSGFVTTVARALPIFPWKSADRASLPGVGERKSTTIELRPAPNSWSRRSATADDSVEGSRDATRRRRGGEPAARAQRARRLGSEGNGPDREHDGRQRDEPAVAVD